MHNKPETHRVYMREYMKKYRKKPEVRAREKKANDIWRAANYDKILEYRNVVEYGKTKAIVAKLKLVYDRLPSDESRRTFTKYLIRAAQYRGDIARVLYDRAFDYTHISAYSEV